MLPKVGVYDMAEGLRFMLFENADNRGISGALKANKVYEPNVQLISPAVLGQAIPGCQCLGCLIKARSPAYGYVR